MDPWSKVDYSRLIREALMVVEKIPEVNPPSGRCRDRVSCKPRSWNRGGGKTEGRSQKRVLSSRVLGQEVNIGQGGPGGGPGCPCGHPARPPGGPRHQGTWTPGCPLRPYFRALEGSFA